MRRRLVAAAVLGLLLVGCGQQGPTATSTSAPATPDAVAASFAAAFAAGDTPTACTYTGGLARQNMSVGGADSLCEHSAWSPQEYWLSRQCVTPAVASLPATYEYVYATNGRIAGADGFLVGVTGADRAWQVTELTSGPAAQLARVCAIVESAQTEVSS